MANEFKRAILVIDWGTSRIRGLLYDIRGQRVDSISVEDQTHLHVIEDGGAEIDAEMTFATTLKILDEIHNRCQEQNWRIEAIANCSLCPTLVGLDADGKPVTPVYTWADVRAAKAAAELRKTQNDDDVYQRTGCVLHASYLPAKLRWLSTTDPGLFSKVKYWCSLGDFLMLLFLDRRICSLSVASWSGMFNRRTMDWDEGLLRTVGVSKNQLSAIDQNGDPVFGLNDNLKNRWPEFANTPWFPPIGDGIANNIGTGCLGPDNVAVMIATSGAFRIILDCNLDHIPAGLWAYCIDRNRWLLGGALSNGGNAIDWLLRTFQIELTQENVRRLQSRSPGSHGLCVLPFLAGERNPFWSDNARGAVVGLTAAASAIDIFQAWIEAIAYQYVPIYQSLQPYLPSDHKIVASGGAVTHYPFLAQIMADVLGRPVSVSDDEEVTSRGLALYTLQKLRLVSDIASLIPKPKIEYSPRPDYHLAHKEGFHRYITLYNKLIGNP
ncbi:MAG TPA: gluconokinase [Blastocatellia bacterium]|nr:gluconokinase [Blastocatellia bacterium]